MADSRSPHGYCPAHDQMFVRDAALVYRRIVRTSKEPDAAKRWALAHHLDTEALETWAASLPKGAQPICFLNFVRSHIAA